MEVQKALSADIFTTSFYYLITDIHPDDMSDILSVAIIP